ncbi:fibroblast growth factor receptor homolog 1-like [Antedon mediterranea]|uniref:fibroblast growth factor receptor homolog 1-like n=1 Tax=Antedon mediterranea TaxID=105859 RepID=UPI003AF4DBC3
MMVNEFVRYGDLFSFMQKIKNKKAPKEKIYDIQPLDQLNMARQIARGMEYIASQRCVHGDLAARNILVDEDLVVKITDFGLSRDVYASNYVRLTKEAKLPWKWYSIEAMTGERKLTTKGDVWSYGIVLFELFTFCDPPYPLIPSLSALVEFLESGRRMKQPVGCPDSVYSIMMKCWNTNPNKRPTFTQLVAEFEKLIGAESVSDYLPIFESGNVTLTNPKMEQLSRSNISLVDKSLASETSSISTQNENHTLDARSDMSQEDAGYENILISQSATYTTDINGDIVLNDGVWVQPEEGYIEPMKNDEKEDDKYKARKINSLKDTKYDVLPPLQSKGDTPYMREDSNGYMAPTDVETAKVTYQFPSLFAFSFYPN